MCRPRPAVSSHFPFALSAALALAVSGCAATGPYPTVVSAESAYVCQDGKVLRVTRAADGNSAAVLVEGRKVPLQRTSGVTEERYTNGTLTLYVEGERALLNSLDRVLFGPCMLQVPPPGTPHNLHQM